MKLLPLGNYPVLATLLACTALHDVRAAIIGTSTPTGIGQYTYSYEVDNRSGTFPIAQWSLDLSIVPDWLQDDLGFGGSVEVPVDWGASAGTPTAGVAAQDFFSLLSDVAPGATLSGFAFVSAFPPGNVEYFEFGLSGESTEGTTVGPMPVPDGGSLWGIVLCLSGAVASLRRFAFCPERTPGFAAQSQTRKQLVNL